MEIVLSARVVDWDTAKSTTFQVARSKENLSWEWNNKLNHLNFKAINKLARKQLVERLPNMVFNNDKV